MAKLSVTIMAHHKRESWIRELAYKLDDVTLSVVWDTNDSVYDTGRRAWLEGIKGRSSTRPPTHHLVLQDDAIVCADLVRGVEKAVTHIPVASPLSLYMGTARPFNDYVTALTDRAHAISPSFIATTRLNWGVGFVFPTAQIPALLDYTDKRGDHMYDRRMSKYFQHKRTPVYYTWPSLIDHRAGPSLLHHRNDQRRARHFIGERESALDVDWSGPVIRVPWKARSVP